MAEWPWNKAGTTGGHGQLAGPGAPRGSSRLLLSQISPAVKTQNSLKVQWLGLWAFTCQGPSFNPWSGN